MESPAASERPTFDGSDEVRDQVRDDIRVDGEGKHPQLREGLS